jgi:hypothetical protein
MASRAELSRHVSREAGDELIRLAPHQQPPEPRQPSDDLNVAVEQQPRAFAGVLDAHCDHRADPSGAWIVSDRPQRDCARGVVPRHDRDLAGKRDAKWADVDSEAAKVSIVLGDLDVGGAGEAARYARNVKQKRVDTVGRRGDLDDVRELHAARRV